MVTTSHNDHNVLHSVRFSVSYLEVLKFKIGAATFVLKAFAAQAKYHPNMLLDPSSYDTVYSTMPFVKQQVKQKDLLHKSHV